MLECWGRLRSWVEAGRGRAVCDERLLGVSLREELVEHPVRPHLHVAVALGEIREVRQLDGHLEPQHGVARHVVAAVLAGGMLVGHLVGRIEDLLVHPEVGGEDQAHHLVSHLPRAAWRGRGHGREGVPGEGGGCG